MKETEIKRAAPRKTNVLKKKREKKRKHYKISMGEGGGGIT